ncbi:MAG: poly(A) polymerase [Bdellovibrionota bacterium]
MAVRQISRHPRRRRREDDSEGFEPGEGEQPQTPGELPGNPLILRREEHPISRKQIDPDALKVMARLIRYGHRAFLVGGGVRDLMLGKVPKDFDIGTDARPESIRSLFRNSRVIGRRFKINHIFFGNNKIFEVSTFRATVEADPEQEGLPISSDNTYGDPQTDALRRDLTINGLFYDLSTFSVIDYVGGIADLRDGIIRVIGEPAVRLREDPVRMIRAIRHAARTGFRIEEQTFQAICELKELIRLSSGARVFEEVLREITGGHSLASFRLLSQTGLLSYLFPVLGEVFADTGSDRHALLEHTLERIDLTIRSGTQIPLSVLFLALFIGNFPNEILESSKPGDTRADISLFWQLSPMEPDEYEDGGTEAPAEEALEPNEGSPKHAEQPRPVTRVRPNVLDKSIEALFKPMSVPRKDREKMSLLLAVRYTLIALYQDGGDTRSILSKHVFQDALLLLKLTAETNFLQACASYWTEQSADFRPGKRQPERSRRRRRPRRGGR